MTMPTLSPYPSYESITTELTAIDSTTSISNTNRVSPIATEKSSLTETNTTTAKLDRITESNDAISFAVITDISTEQSQRQAKKYLYMYFYICRNNINRSHSKNLYKRNTITCNSHNPNTYTRKTGNSAFKK